ncbi:60S ribosomal protein L17 [Gymnopilus junonius]|uniref:Large ribosomal subunit protein mL46 n=1 Tax=Gymnopilus junonius TaxID=109634 RepID=A0A9P5TH79_GYMJU|nr:60S ribosomal protein L17 [Gymnopilus junonius]
MLSSRCAAVSRPLWRSFAIEATSEQSVSSRAKKPQPCISTAIILNRAPILTRSPTAFEQAYYSYQARIRRSLHNPFPYDFYFKPGTLLETRFNLEERKRERLAFGPGFLEKEDISEEKRQANIAAVEQLAQQEGEGEELMPRTHSSDLKEDTKSLDRRGQRNLYLLLHTSQDGKNIWRFPQGGVEKGQFLHQAAQQDLLNECGDKMDTWIVGKAPIGVHKPQPSQAETEGQEQVVFFFKAHILAGQVAPAGNSIQDFAWLTKQEIRTRVDEPYWNSIKDILSDY